LIDRHIKRLALPGLFLGSQPCDARPTANDALLAGQSLITHAEATLAGELAGNNCTRSEFPNCTRRAANGEHPLSDTAGCAWDFEESKRRVWR
jgi:hypothetical protein